jgi:hypothetical protein
MLNHDQFICLYAGIGVAVLMGLCPPWSDHGGSTGYGALWSPPTSGSSISTVRLLVQWVIVAGLTCAAITAAPRVRHRWYYSASAERSVMPEAGDLGDAIGGAFRRAAQ